MYKVVAMPWEEIARFVDCPECSGTIGLGAGAFDGSVFECPYCGEDLLAQIKLTRAHNECYTSLLALVESFRRTQHDYVDGDCWYSCPSHPEYCGDQPVSDCICGLDEHNAKVDECLRLIRELIGE